jgi:aspartyl-tRNA(Asn)/glutamyl-tRNA(Gln) amidotransferase subunit A
MPVAHSAEGLPIGLQFVGRPYGDETVIALAGAVQQVSDEHLRVPQLRR